MLTRLRLDSLSKGSGNERYGCDCEGVSTPVDVQSAFRVLPTIAGHQKLQVENLDTKTSYLNETMREVIAWSVDPARVGTVRP